MIVSSPLFEAFLECHTKCWLRSCAEPNAGNAYADWARAQNDAYYEDGRDRLLAMRPESDRAIAPPISKYTKDAKWRLAVDVHLQTNNLESRSACCGKDALRRAGQVRPVCPTSFRIR